MSTERVTGDTIAGRYVLDALLGAGAFGQVWSAHDARAFNRRVAVKFLLEQHLMNAEVVGRFWREGQAMAALTHPNVVAMIEFGEDGGIPYLVNEFVEGESLRAIIDARARRRDMLPRADAIAVFRQLCAGVGAAHDKGIVHRDLKPENVMIRGIGGAVHVKVLDFGVARILDSGTGDRTKTESGRIIGSLQYMSPEQVLGDMKNIDTRSDLFALGALFYEILTLHQAFDGTSFHEVVTSILQGERPRVTMLRPDLSPETDDVVFRALAGRAADRYSHATEMLAAAEHALDSQSPAATMSAAGTSRAPPGADPRALDSGTLAATISASADGVPPKPRARGGTLVMLAIAATVLAVGGYALRSRFHTSRVDPRPIVAVHIPDAITTLSADASPDVPPLDDPSFWVGIAAPPTAMRLGWDDDAHAMHGFASSANITFPGPVFHIHRREVTWAAFEAWASGHVDREVRPPSWLPPAASERATLPVVGVSWQLARQYCQALGGDLPTEAQWEYAARGPERRLNPWGNAAAPTDLAAFLGRTAQLRSVGTSPGDRTPLGVEDLAGNAEEWTATRYRTDDGQEPGWTVSERTIRGLPLRDPRPGVIPPAGIYRNSGCITDQCAVDDRTALESIGFRCARP